MKSSAPRIWLFAITPIIFLAVAGSVTYWVVNILDCTHWLFESKTGCKWEIPEVPEGSKTLPLNELLSRLVWGVSVLFVTVSASSALYLILGALSIIADFRVRYALRCLIIVMLPILYILSKDLSYSFNKGLLDETVYSFSPVAHVVRSVEAVGHTVLLGLAITKAAVLWRSLDRLSLCKSDFKKTAVSVLDAQRLVGILLYSGAITLVAGTLHSSALYSWSYSIFSAYRDSEQPALVEYSVMMGSITGGLYSLLLAAVFTPAFILMHWMAYRLANQANEGEPADIRSQWLIENKLNFSVPKSTITAMMVLAPTLFGGPGVSIFQQLFSP